MNNIKRAARGHIYSPAMILFLLSAGVAAGVLNGLLGSGGGIITVYVLSLCRRKYGDGGYSSRDVFASSIASILPMTVVSALLYGGDFSFRDAYIYILPAVCGGLAGAYLLDKINKTLLKRIFALLVIWAGASMILREAGVL